MSSDRPILLVLGIRPDVIRASIIIREMKRKLGANFLFIWSGQHYSDNLKDVFFRQLGVPEPDLNWNIRGDTDAELISDLISKANSTIEETNPAAIIFLGDTNTVMASIAAAAHNVPIVHIEGCMRSYDWRMPEEKFRTVIDHLSDLIFAYLPEYREQGILEGITPAQIVVTGNPIVDVLAENFVEGKLRMDPSDLDSWLRELEVEPKDYLLMTCHRRENIQNTKSLRRIMDLVKETDRRVVFPAGYRTQRELKERGVSVPDNVIQLDPIGYQEFLELLANSAGVLTDSGTVVEEAAIMGIPSLQMRTSTERPQVYECGGSIKFDPHEELDAHSRREILSAFWKLASSAWEHPFGDGKASRRMVDEIIRRYSARELAGNRLDHPSKPIGRAYGQLSRQKS